MTRFIGVREFRQNLAKIAEDARKKSETLVVLKHNKPILKVEPLSQEDVNRAEFLKGIEEARMDAKEGRIYTLEEIEKKYGLT